MSKKKILVILRIAVLIFVSLLMGIKLYNWNARNLTGNVLPMPFGYGASVVLSGSMEPAIMTNELILVKAEDSYEVGDVVVFQNGNVLVVHRIVAMDEETVVTRGDANNTDDQPIALEQIKGRVFAHIPHVGTVVRVIKTPVATIALILGAVLLVELPFQKEKEKKEGELEKIKAEIRRLKEEQDR